MKYLAHLSDACDLTGSGFRFEEGGCFAMAIAIGRALGDDGHECRLAFGARVKHAFVEVDGALYDHSGQVFGRHDVFHVSEAEMRSLAAAHGHGPDDLEADLSAALEVVQTARELEGARSAMVGWLTQNTGYDEGEAEELFDHVRTPDNAVFLWHVVGSDHVFAALEEGSHLRDNEIDRVLTGTAARLARRAFETTGGGQALRDLVEKIKDDGVWAAAAGVLEDVTKSGPRANLG